MSLKKSATDDLKCVTTAFNCMCKFEAAVSKKQHLMCGTQKVEEKR